MTLCRWRRDVILVVRGRDGEAAAAGGVLSARGVGRGAIVGARPPFGGHVLQRASVDDGSKSYVSAMQRGSNEQPLIIIIIISDIDH